MEFKIIIIQKTKTIIRKIKIKNCLLIIKKKVNNSKTKRRITIKI